MDLGPVKIIFTITGEFRHGRRCAIFLPELGDGTIRSDMVWGSRWSLLKLETMHAGRSSSDEGKGDNNLVQHGSGVEVRPRDLLPFKYVPQSRRTQSPSLVDVVKLTPSDRLKVLEGGGSVVWWEVSGHGC